ncbi:MAG: zinc-dependent dehydrogenase [bacterium]
MKAAVLEDLNKLSVKEVETPDVDEGEVLVRVRACAVCGSDLRIYHYGNPRVRPPQIIGHEIAGEVAAVGRGVDKFKIGDRVATGADVPCGVCYFCKNGMGNNCPINYAIGYQFPGGFAEYILLNETTVKYGPVHKIPGNLSFEEAALAEPLACCINGLELSRLAPGETVVIIGAGPVGCLLIELAKTMGAGKVIIAQRSKARLEMARRFRADAFISTTEENFVDRVMEETEGEGADVVITACASPDAQEDAVKVVRNRGRVNFFGGLPRGTRKISIDSNIVHYKECYIHGSHGSVPRQHKAALSLLADGRIRAGDFISHRFPLDDILEAFRAVEDREGMKVVVTP